MPTPLSPAVYWTKIHSGQESTLPKRIRKHSSKTLRDAPTLLPAALGYAMPAEWEPHAATWLAWPHNHDDWPG